MSKIFFCLLPAGIDDYQMTIIVRRVREKNNYYEDTQFRSIW